MSYFSDANQEWMRLQEMAQRSQLGGMLGASAANQLIGFQQAGQQAIKQEPPYLNPTLLLTGEDE